jgi:hypothetical protein
MFGVLLFKVALVFSSGQKWNEKELLPISRIVEAKWWILNDYEMRYYCDEVKWN